jgi:hypothetical protein
MTVYECHFIFKDMLQKVSSDGGPLVFAQGFWVNDALEYTQGDDCQYWIPPSQIRYIKKVDVPEVEVTDVGSEDGS